MMAPDDLPDETTMERQATRWFARRRSGDMTDEQSRAFQAWLEADERHRDAFEALETIWGGLGHTRDAPEVVTLRAAARQRPRGPSRRGFVWRAAAGLALMAGVGGAIWLSAGMGAFTHKDFPNQTFRTDVGQRSTVVLPDGSTVILNTATVLRTAASADERVIFLDRGQAFFRVAKDKTHPFVVHAGGRTVTAVGTAFDVRADPAGFEVTLVEGKVKVETALPRANPIAGAVLKTPTQATELVPGTQFIAMADDERWSVRRADAETETAWVTGWLKFDRTPLREVVAELSRYSTRRIVLDDPSIGSLPISGRFKAGDMDAFVEGVAVYGITPISDANPAELRLRQQGG